MKAKEEYTKIPYTFLPELSGWLDGKEGKLFEKMNRFIVYNWLKKLGKLLDIPALTTSQDITGEKTITHIFRKSMGKDLLYGTHVQKPFKYSTPYQCLLTGTLYLYHARKIYSNRKRTNRGQYDAF